MGDTFKFPNGGYEINIVRKQDVINSINDNIIDKEVALEIIKQLEITATNYIKKGRWTGIPFIGNIRIPKTKLMLRSAEQQELITEASETLNTQDYILFRRKLNEENEKKVRIDRYYRYIVSIAINKQRDLFKKIAKDKGECFARIYLFSLSCIKAVENEYEILNYGE